jgi:hypothetical protein
MPAAPLAPLLGALLALSPAHGKRGDGTDTEERRKHLDVAPKAKTDFTAYTLGHHQWRVGLLNLDYGLLPNASIGTSPVLNIFATNARIKATAITWGRFDFSAQAGIMSLNTRMLGVENVDANIVPLKGTASWAFGPRLGLHMGGTWMIARLRGDLTGDQLQALLGDVTNADSEDSGLASAIGDNAYAGAVGNINIAQQHVALEWRLNRRDSIVFQSNNTLYVSGVVAGTAGISDEESGVQAGAGIGVTFDLDPSQAFGSASSIAWQWSWKKANLRVGVPLTPQNPQAWAQCVQLYWLLGPEPEPEPLPDRQHIFERRRDRG